MIGGGPLPEATGNVGVTSSKKGTTSISIGFNEALNVASADKSSLYQLKGGVKKHGKTVYTSAVTIKTSATRAAKRR